MKKAACRKPILRSSNGIIAVGITLIMSSLIMSLMTIIPASATEERGKITDIHWSFENWFGKFDAAQLRRGYQVYAEVCASCHSLKYVPFRTLTDSDGPHFTDGEVKSFLENYSVIDKNTGESRQAKIFDVFPIPEALYDPPDLSLMVKARAGFDGPLGTGINRFIKGTGGAEYIYSLLTGYTGEEKEQAGSVLYGNHVFGFIAMPPPLQDGMVEYTDGTKADVKQMAMDVTAFLAWTAEPHMTDRKRTGIKSLVILTIFAILLWLCYRQLWAPLKRNDG